MCENRWSSKMWALKTVTWSNEHVHLPSCTFIHHCTLKNSCSEQFSVSAPLDRSTLKLQRGERFLWNFHRSVLLAKLQIAVGFNQRNVNHNRHNHIKIHQINSNHALSALHRLDLESSGFCARGSFRILQVNSYLRVLRRMPLWCEDFQDDFEWFRCRFTCLNLDKDCIWCEISNHLEVWEMSGKHSGTNVQECTWKL